MKLNLQVVKISYFRKRKNPGFSIFKCEIPQISSKYLRVFNILFPHFFRKKNSANFGVLTTTQLFHVPFLRVSNNINF